MILLNKIKHNNKLFQVCLDEKKNRVIYEIKTNNDSKIYYSFPELSDLLEITRKYFISEPVSNIKASYKKVSLDDIDDIFENTYNNNNKNDNNRKKLKISQKVLIAGLVIAISISFPATVKSYILDKDTTFINQIVQSTTKISTIDELNNTFDTSAITVDIVHTAIDEQQNFTDEEKKLIHEFVNDVNNKRPNQDWWIFYQNIKKMNIIYVTSIEGANGLFWHDNAHIDIVQSLDEQKKKEVLRHELTHALTIFLGNVDGYKVQVDFFNNQSEYGKRTLEMLTSLFNSQISDYNDLSYGNEQFIFQPIIDTIGINNFIEPLFSGDIYSFINICKPYYSEIEDYIAYFEAFFCSLDKNKVNSTIDKDLILKFNDMTLDFYLNTKAHQLKTGKINFQEYISDKNIFVTDLFFLIKNTADMNDIEFNFQQLDQLKLFNEKEENIIDSNILNKIRVEEDNYNYNLFWRFYFNKEDKTIENFSLHTINYDTNIIRAQYLYDTNEYNINDFYFIVEQSPYENLPKLRLINNKYPEYNNIDLITGKKITNTDNILYIVPLLQYINSIEKSRLLLYCHYFNEEHINFNNYLFEVDNIIEFANNTNIVK